MKRETRVWLKELRNQRSMTQLDVASKARIERSYYTMIERGMRTPSVAVAKEISAALGFNWTIFFETECNESTRKKSAV